MGMRMRKSIKLGPGVRLNVSHKSAGVRIGGRGGGVSFNSSGRHTASVGIPGTGIGYSTRVSGGRGRPQARRASTPVAPPSPPKPGLFAPAYEKSFYKAVQRYIGGDVSGALALFKEASAKDPSGKALANDFFVGLLAVRTEDDATAASYLEKVVHAQEPLPDQLMTKYLDGGGVAVAITDHVRAEVPFGSLAATLTLAEVYQRLGRVDEAIGLVQQLVDIEPHPFLVLSLCDLYAETGAWDEIVDVAARTINEDDVSLQIRLLQARAFEAQGMHDAALEAYKDSLRSKKRDPDLLKEARYSRARLYLANGKKAQGRKELEKLYAEDSTFRDVQALLSEV